MEKGADEDLKKPSSSSITGQTAQVFLKIISAQISVMEEASFIKQIQGKDPKFLSIIQKCIANKRVVNYLIIR